MVKSQQVKTSICAGFTVLMMGLAGILPAHAQTQSTSPAPMPALSPPQTAYDGPLYKRQLYVVTNMERALTLWRDVIGWTPGEVTTSGPQSYSREVFNIPAKARLRFTTLSAGTDQIRTLALAEVTGVRLPSKRGVRVTAAVINTRGKLDFIITRAREMGLTVFSKRPLVTTDQGTGTEQGFMDWDGNVIVLYEFPVK
jgi:hypothetical protein